MVSVIRELMDEFSMSMSMSIYYNSPAPVPAGTIAPTTATSATTPTTQGPGAATSKTSSPTTTTKTPTPPMQPPSAAPAGSDSPVPIVTLPPNSALTQTPTSSPPSIEAPSSAPILIQDIGVGVGGLACDGLSRSIVRVLLDVETAPGVGSFVLALEVALLNALSVDFPFCDIARFSGRKLVDDFHLGGVDVALSSGGGTNQWQCPLALLYRLSLLAY
jgi:hypothetical protein